MRNFDINEVIKKIHYEPQTGEFTWKTIEEKTRADKYFNSRFAEQPAGDYESKHGYRRIFLFGKRVKAHQLAWFIMTRDWPNSSIDHINGDRKDNRWDNLRVSSKKENSKNQATYKNNKSGCCGVYYCKSSNKWRAQIGGNGTKGRDLGCYDLLEEAISVRKKAEKEFGYHKNHGRKA